ncbi:MAG: FtsH protease activity modulator HflK [Planctomycetota bacterium]
MNQPPKRPFPDSWPEAKGVNVDLSPKFLFVVLFLALLVSGVWSMFYTVKPESEGVVLRFGKFKEVQSPGLHFKLPFGIDQVTMVPRLRQLKLEFGAGTSGATNPYQVSDAREQEAEKSMVTGDLNAALVEWVIQYRKEDPKAYLFHVRNPDGTLRDAAESVMREVVGDRTVDEVITIGRQGIESECLVKLQALVTEYDMGIQIDQVQLNDVNPPRAVQASFNEVNEAQQRRETSINEANKQYNSAIPRADGQATQAVRSAEGYATKRTNEALGDVAAFNAVLAEYLKAPDITKRRIYLETMGDVLPSVREKIILDKSATGILPLLNLSGTQAGGNR